MALPFPPLPFSPRTFTFRLSRAKSRKLLPIDPPATASQPPDVLHSLRHYHQPPDVLRPSSSRRTTLQPSAAPADPVTAVTALDQETSLSEKVVKAQHSTQGRGGAIIQVELRDVDSGNKVNERFRTDETIEKIFVEAKSYTYLYTDEESETVVLLEPNTFIQLDVPKHLFGNSLAYLKADELTLLIYYEKSMSLDDITISVELFNDRPMSASVPKRVICTVVEAQVPMKGMGATPHTKKVLLDNGLKVEVPPHIITGDKILIDTTDDSYISRCVCGAKPGNANIEIAPFKRFQ
ncbi:hypothetical protein R6Q59_036222 [Mikania micrantha]